MLHGLPEYQTDDIPTCAFDMSEGSRPVAYSIACEAPCDFGCVTCWLTLLSWGVEESAFRLAVVVKLFILAMY